MDEKQAVHTALRGLLLLFVFPILTACNSVGAGGSSGEDKIASEKVQCVSTAIENQYIVSWKDGSFSTFKNLTREELIEQVIDPAYDQVESAEQDHMIYLPQKPVFNDGDVFAQNVVTSGSSTYWGQYKIQADQVWAQNYYGEGVTVAVVDSGVDFTHAQLSPRAWRNTREISGNGVDDDGNGYIDDVNGFDFKNRTGSVTDTGGHGTHVSGIIAADPNFGSAYGVAPRAKIMGLRFIDRNSGAISAAIEAIQYAVANGAKVINASWGGGSCSSTLYSAIASAGNQGVLFVTAAGNGDASGRGQNIENYPQFPASFGLPLQITVGASTSNDYMTTFSNYSDSLVHLFAPGAEIVSTWPGNQLMTEDGTSMASPFVAGAAALLWGAHPSASISQIRNALLNSVDQGNSLRAVSKGRLNVLKAMQSL